MFGDPYFNPDDATVDEGSYDPTRYGALGRRPKYPVGSTRIFSICHLFDPICQGLGHDVFSQHTNYQDDKWVGIAAAKIAAALKPAVPALVVDDQSRLHVGGKPPIGVGSKLSEADAVFGTAATHGSGTANDPVDCYASWSSYGVSTLFQNFSATATTSSCQPSTSFSLSTAALIGHGWRTDRGLAVGDPIYKIRQLYPEAKPDQCGSVNFGGGYPGYGLIRKADPTGGPESYVDTLCAIVRGANVAGFGISRTGE